MSERRGAHESICPDAAVLAAYVDGALPADARERLERHLVGCADCREVVAETTLFAGEAERRPAIGGVTPRRHRWLPVAAAGLAAAATVAIAVRMMDRPGGSGPELGPLVSAVSAQPTRLVEARLSGFPYGPPPARVRAGSSTEVPASIRAEAARIEEAAADAGGSADHALGIAHLAVGRLDDAIETLRRAEQSEPGNPRLSSDLGAALLVRASTTASVADARAALEAAEQALGRGRGMPEALFNKALALEALDRRADAARAWDEYLRVDETSPWAEEARRRADALR